MQGCESDIVKAWHEALNEGDIDRLLELTDDDVEVGGPRGSGQGKLLLREWFGRAGIRLTPGQVFHRGATVVVEQEAEWRSGETGEVASRDSVASVFTVESGRVQSITRYPDLASALDAAGLGDADRV